MKQSHYKGIFITLWILKILSRGKVLFKTVLDNFLDK